MSRYEEREDGTIIKNVPHEVEKYRYKVKDQMKCQ